MKKIMVFGGLTTMSVENQVRLERFMRYLRRTYEDLYNIEECPLVPGLGDSLMYSVNMNMGSCDIFLVVMFSTPERRIEIELRRDDPKACPVYACTLRALSHAQQLGQAPVADCSNICIGVNTECYGFKEWRFDDSDLGIIHFNEFLKTHRLPFVA